MALLRAPRDRVVPKYLQCLEAMDLLEQLLEDCHRLGIAPRHLQDAGAEAAPVKALLKEAQGLWQEGRPDLALQFLEAVEARGLRHGWIDDHRARCLLQLQRREEAEAIWQQLAAGQDNVLKTAAEAMLKRLQLEAQQPAFLAAAQQLATTFDVHLQRLTAEQQPSPAFEHALLEEAIAAREADQAEFSLALMDLALEKGYRSPWLQDNRARALVQLERAEEACDAWRGMEEQADSDHARRTAIEMLGWLRPKAELQRRWRLAEGHGERAAELLAAGDREAAVAALVDGLLVGPDHGGLKRQLSDLLGQRRLQNDRQWKGLPDWIQRHELALEVSALVLQGLSRRCADSTETKAVAAPAAVEADAVPAGSRPAGWR